MIAWSKALPKGPAYLHIFRKTSLQYARSGENLNRQVSSNARLSEGVMMTSYVEESDVEMRAKSNRTFRRIAASLPPGGRRAVRVRRVRHRPAPEAARSNDRRWSVRAG